MKFLDLPYRKKNLKEWEELVHRIQHPLAEVAIGVVGKYVAYEDSYKSLREALLHGGVASNLKVNLRWIEAEDMVNGKLEAELDRVDGILVPGGFGIRGVAGMIEAIRYARERSIPFFAICLGLQCAVIECARNLCGLAGADSTEFDENTPHRVIYKLRDLLGVDALGGTMRLGSYPAALAPASRARKAYGADVAHERHRHRYEVNQEFRPQLEAAGLRMAERLEHFSLNSPPRRGIRTKQSRSGLHPERLCVSCGYTPEAISGKASSHSQPDQQGRFRPEASLPVLEQAVDPPVDC